MYSIYQRSRTGVNATMDKFERFASLLTRIFVKPHHFTYCSFYILLKTICILDVKKSSDCNFIGMSIIFTVTIYSPVAKS